MRGAPFYGILLTYSKTPVAASGDDAGSGVTVCQPFGSNQKMLWLLMQGVSRFTTHLQNVTSGLERDVCRTHAHCALK